MHGLWRCALLLGVAVQVGDGTTSVCLLAGEFLKSIKGYIEDGVHPQTVIKGFRDALREVRNNHKRHRTMRRKSIRIVRLRNLAFV